MFSSSFGASMAVKKKKNLSHRGARRAALLLLKRLCSCEVDHRLLCLRRSAIAKVSQTIGKKEKNEAPGKLISKKERESKQPTLCQLVPATSSICVAGCPRQHGPRRPETSSSASDGVRTDGSLCPGFSFILFSLRFLVALFPVTRAKLGFHSYQNP